MINRLIFVLLAWGFPLVCASNEGAIVRGMWFPTADVRDVMSYYERLTGKPVLVDISTFGTLVTIESSDDFSRDAAVDLIRRTLLEGYGIELRTSDRGETLVTWSKDPKYPRRSDPPRTEAKENTRLKSKIRIIRPAGN